MRVITDPGGTSVVVEADGEALGDVTVWSDGGIVRLRFNVPRRHLPATARRDLVDAVFALPELDWRGPVQAAIPLGDADLLAGLRVHLGEVETRAAGATCLIDATLE
jgi:hypothetical protein